MSISVDVYQSEMLDKYLAGFSRVILCYLAYAAEKWLVFLSNTPQVTPLKIKRRLR